MSEYFIKPIVKTLMLKGQEGQSIKGITKTGTSGLVDTYTVTLTDGTTSTFSITNGKGISSIKKTGTNGLVDTYTTTYNDGTTSTFTVTNGEGIQNLQIGGRNLYYLKDFSTINKTRISNYSVENGEITITASDRDIYFGYVALSEGESYSNVYGPLMYVEGTSFVTISISNPEFSHNYITFFDKDKKSISFININSNAKKGLMIPSGATYLTLRVGIAEAVSGTTYKTRIKVELGNIATDWTPAPEDLETTAITNAEIDNIVK